MVIKWTSNQDWDRKPADWSEWMRGWNNARGSGREPTTERLRWFGSVHEIRWEEIHRITFNILALLVILGEVNFSPGILQCCWLLLIVAPCWLMCESHQQLQRLFQQPLLQHTSFFWLESLTHEGSRTRHDWTCRTPSGGDNPDDIIVTSDSGVWSAWQRPSDRRPSVCDLGNKRLQGFWQRLRLLTFFSADYNLISPSSAAANVNFLCLKLINSQ